MNQGLQAKNRSDVDAGGRVTIAYTPGPWNVRFRADGSCYISIGDHRTGPHKQFDLQLERGRDNDEADASLIAAAPGLLSALIDVLKQIDESDYWWMDCPDRGGFDADSIRWLIGKATGVHT